MAGGWRMCEILQITPGDFPRPNFANIGVN